MPRGQRGSSRPSRGEARTAEGPEQRPGAHLVRSPQWAGLHVGDAVVVDGVRARGAAWEFLAHVRNTRTGAEWVEVVGGRAGDRSVRSFRPEQIFVPQAPSTAGRGRGGARLSLADEPRLPL